MTKGETGTAKEHPVTIFICDKVRRCLYSDGKFFPLSLYLSVF